MGAVNLDNTGSGSAITLTSDGTSLLLDGTAIGGGGGGSSFTSIVENYSNGTAPSVTGNDSVGIGDNVTVSANDSYAIGHYATCAGALSIALGLQANVTSGASQAVALGDNATAGAGTSGVALGTSYVSATDAFAAAIANNTSSYGATGSNSIAIGDLAKATNSNAVCISNTSTASASNSAVLGGSSGTASANGSVALGGSSNVADGIYSTAKGYYGNANGIRLKHATGVYPNQQGAYYVLGHTTSDATPIALNTSVWTPNATNQVVLPNNSAYFFSGTCIARQQAADGTDVGAWEFKGVIRREANAGTTTLIKSTIDDFNVPTGWALALSADTTNGCLKVQATGVASTDIRWVATVQTSEVTYA